MRKITRRRFVKQAAAGVALPAALTQSLGGVLGAGAALAQGAETWPNRPIRFIVHLAAGGGLDFIARLVADPLSRALGQQVFVENRTGGGSTIGIDAAIKSPPDGYSILVCNDNVVSAPHVMRLNSEFVKDLIPVILLARQPQSLAVHPSLNLNSVAELVTLLKQNPGMGYASSGVGSNQHVIGEAFGKAAGVKIEHVPYRGAGQAINDLIAGHVKVAFLGPTALIPHHNTGAIRMIAQSGGKRSPSVPDIPTLVESGYDIDIESWYGMLTPLGTPPAINARLHAECTKVLADPAIRASIIKAGNEVAGGSPEDFAKVLATDAAKYARYVKDLNIKAAAN
jgi:tripartite-type tricarboxylate transporter receptor subunit TctC